jgi:hypothetical protein
MRVEKGETDEWNILILTSDRIVDVVVDCNLARDETLCGRLEYQTMSELLRHRGLRTRRHNKYDHEIETQGIRCAKMCLRKPGWNGHMEEQPCAHMGRHFLRLRSNQSPRPRD